MRRKNIIFFPILLNLIIIHNLPIGISLLLLHHRQNWFFFSFFVTWKFNYIWYKDNDEEENQESRIKNRSFFLLFKTFFLSFLFFHSLLNNFQICFFSREISLGKNWWNNFLFFFSLSLLSIYVKFFVSFCFISNR